MTASQIIVLATPVFFLLIAIEFAWARHKKREVYALSDAINSVGLGVLSQVSAVFTRLLRVGVYTAIYSTMTWVPPEQAQAFWSTWYGWLLALVFYDFCYYWLHRMGHESAVLWAAHVVHHQSQRYNLSTALRQTSSGALLGWVFYIPMALAGVPPLVFGIVALVDLLYQFWVHTEFVGKLGWFDRVFCSPSNHRVHHAVNDAYVDKNYGGIWVVWDRVFGTFKMEEDKEPCVYGTRSPLNSWDPLWANAEVYKGLLHDSWHANNWLDKLRVWLKPPGWRPADVAAKFPKPSFEIRALTLYQPALSRGAAWFGGLQFLLLLNGVTVYLWQSHTFDWAQKAVGFGVLVTFLWAIGAVLQGRISVLMALMVESAALATASGALHLTQLHYFFKPLTLLIAIIFVAKLSINTLAKVRYTLKNDSVAGFDRDFLLLAGLTASLVGDVFLMFDGYFVPGLLAFLTAHLFYIARLKRGVPWFASRGALLASLGFGVAMFAFLAQGGLPAGLRIPVAVYVLVISLMGAQAIGRSWVLHNAPASWVAVGAVFFMASDTLLAINRFVQPLPLASLWVLATYYVAQTLIATQLSSATFKR